MSAVVTYRAYPFPGAWLGSCSVFATIEEAVRGRNIVIQNLINYILLDNEGVAPTSHMQRMRLVASDDADRCSVGSRVYTHTHKSDHFHVHEVHEVLVVKKSMHELASLFRSAFQLPVATESSRPRPRDIFAYIPADKQRITDRWLDCLNVQKSRKMSML